MNQWPDSGATHCGFGLSCHSPTQPTGRTVKNTATEVSRTVTTTATGDFVAPNLEPGPYTVTVEAASFKKEQRTGLQLEVAKDIRLTFKLTAGAATEVVTVTGEVPIVDVTSDVLGGTYTLRFTAPGFVTREVRDVSVPAGGARGSSGEFRSQGRRRRGARWVSSSRRKASS